METAVVTSKRNILFIKNVLESVKEYRDIMIENKANQQDIENINKDIQKIQFLHDKAEKTLNDLRRIIENFLDESISCEFLIKNDLCLVIDISESTTRLFEAAMKDKLK